MLVREVVDAAGVGFDAVKRIAVTTGPGSFTGLRVGLSFAKGLGFALGVPVVGVGTLEALAASEATGGLVLAAVDAKRGQVWMQAFRDGAAIGSPEAPDASDAAARAAVLLEGEKATVVGSAAEMLGSTPSAMSAPDIATVARLGATRDPALHPAEPIYLRAPDAKKAAA